ncbi:MAG: hypothetical protein LQ346_000618 [Caloplaca aetnensis]|nr:MAG: hypothetical protein LQ346_000618 [Caloplaca aetnensis]
MGKILRAIGINWIFTPTLDTLNEFIEPCDASQTFGKNAESVSGHALALIQGLATECVAACTNAHPAGEVMEIFRTRSSTDLADDIHEQSALPEFFPIGAAVTRYPRNSTQFRTAIHDFPEPVQSAHNVRAASELVLRNKWRFRGPTVSSFAKTPNDAAVCPEHAPLLTFQAGLDMVTLPKDAAIRESSLSVLELAMTSKVLPSGLISTCAARVAAFKDQLFTWEEALTPRQAEHLLLPAPSILAHGAYRSATTALSPGASPLVGIARTSIVVLLTPTVPRRKPDSPSDPFEPLGRALSRSFPRIRHVPYTLSAGLTEVYLPFLQRATAVVFVLCNTSSAMIESQDEFVRALHNNLRARDAMPGQEKTRKVVVGAGDPRDLRDPFTGWWGALCYEYSRGALEAVAEVVLGERKATGKLPS